MTPSSQARTVLVLGANGRFGRAAVDAFAAAGWAVRAQTRRPPTVTRPGVQAVIGDALDSAALAPAAACADLIVHALNPDYTRWDQLLPPLTAAVIDLAARSGSTLLVPGNVYNFGRHLPPRLDENTPFIGDHPKARQRIALEAALAEAAATRGVRSIVLRAGDFLGATGTWFDLGLARALQRGRFTHMDAPDLPHAWAWLPDLAAAAVAVAERRAALAPHTVLHFAGHTLTSAELQAAAERALAPAGRRLRAINFPWWQLRLAAPFAALPRAVIEMRHLWQRPHQLDGTRLAALIGPVPHTPLDVLMRRSLALLDVPAAAAKSDQTAARTT